MRGLVAERPPHPITWVGARRYHAFGRTQGRRVRYIGSVVAARGGTRSWRRRQGSRSRVVRRRVTATPIGSRNRKRRRRRSRRRNRRRRSRRRAGNDRLATRVALGNSLKTQAAAAPGSAGGFSRIFAAFSAIIRGRF